VLVVPELYEACGSKLVGPWRCKNPNVYSSKQMRLSVLQSNLNNRLIDNEQDFELIAANKMCSKVATIYSGGGG